MSAFDEIAYSNEGQLGRDIFLAEFSDVMFYFEDADYEPVYEKLIALITPEYLTNAIVCLGGKGNVIKAANSSNDIRKPRIFVVDRDFDDFLGLRKEIDGLIYLDRFCFENYLMSFSAILGVAIDRFSLLGTKAHKDCEDFEAFYGTILDRYVRLTRLFLVVRKNRLPIQSTKIPYSEFILGPHVSDILPESVVDEFRGHLLTVAAVESDWIVQPGILDVLEASAFEKSEGDPDFSLEARVCGKHMFGFMKAYVFRAAGVDLEGIPLTSLYMDMMGRIANFRDSFASLSTSIKDSVHRQRELLFA